jgi:phosphoribosylaminoimidazolecarboxamide formyltransferase/IMP cyclohydrolase
MTMLNPPLTPIKRALLSVTDKTGIENLARELIQHGVEIISTGGTAALLKKSGLNITDISDFTGFPEIMDGRVKTLHPKVHGGILARRSDEAHAKAMEAHNIQGIDLVVINLYRFEDTVAKGGDFAACIENIDIGGPAMIRAAAKNHDFVTILTDPNDYPSVLQELTEHKGSTTPPLRKALAAKAYARTAAYDGAIAAWLSNQLGEPAPAHFVITGARHSVLRYGENPHQLAAFYTDGSNRPGAALAGQIQGKDLSYNNLNDTDAAYELVAEFDAPTVAIIKHANPCGVASANNMAAAYRAALACDPVSAFGGIIALNRPLDGETAAEIVKIFTEVIIAPDATAEARGIIAAKNNLRLLLTGALPDPAQKRLAVKAIAGGYLVQDSDTARITENNLKTVTKRLPSTAELEDMLFAFRVAKHVKSNAIVYARGGATLGIGAGQMSRIDSSRIAAWKMKEQGLSPENGHLVVASDAFFPFADGLIAAADAGVTAIIQPGGSMRDAEIIAAADDRGLAMVFTGVRHFRH